MRFGPTQYEYCTQVDFVLLGIYLLDAKNPGTPSGTPGEWFPHIRVIDFNESIPRTGLCVTTLGVTIINRYNGYPQHGPKPFNSTALGKLGSQA